MIPSTLCYIKKDNCILLLHRVKKNNDLNEGKWIGVGGKAEPGETPEQCVLREVYEETGLKLTKYHCHGLIKFISDKWEDEDMYLYSATEFEGEVKSDCPEGDLKWIPCEEVLNMPTWEGDHYFLEPLLSGEERIDMLVQYEGDKLVKCEDLTEPVDTLKSSLISSPHGFSSRRGGVSDGIFESLNLGMNRGDDKLRVTENWNRFLDSCGISNRAFVCGNQVHENNVHIATKADLRPAYGPGELIKADGYVTNEPNVPLAIFIADCVPVLLEDCENRVIGAVHCGWRSTVADIQGQAVGKMRDLGSKPENIKAAIGPSIDKCCFEVGREVVEAVNQLLGSECGKDFYSNKKTENVIQGNVGEDKGEAEKYMLDLRGVVKQRFIQLGLLPENIEIVGPCTMCNPDKFWSHRYTKGERGSQAASIMLK